MDRVYVWNFYYPKAAPLQSKLREANRIIAEIAGKNSHVVGMGEQALTICFVSDLTHEQLREKIRPIADEKLWTILFEAGALVGGIGREDALRWLTLRLPSERISSRSRSGPA